MTLVLCFKTRELLLNGLGRPHIWYEGGELNGQLAGINFPRTTFLDWIASGVVLTRQEKDAYTMILKYPEYHYIIGVLEGDRSTVLHERAHATYYLDNRYCRLVNRRWTELSEKTQRFVEKRLKECGYSDDRLVDEFQAYLVENQNVFKRSEFAPLQQELKAYLTTYKMTTKTVFL